MQKFLFMSCVALLFLCGCVQEQQVDTLNILFTGEASGELEPCGCTGMKTGGIAQRSGWIRHFRDSGGKWVLIDGGFATKKSGRQQKMKFTTYRKMLKVMEYEFSCVTQQEQNLVTVPKPYFGDFRGKKFVILRLETEQDKQQAQTILQQKSIDLVIVMARGKTSSQVSEGFPQGDFWRIFLINDAQNPITPFTPQEKTIVLSAGDRGRYAGVLRFSWEKNVFSWKHEHIAITNEHGADEKVLSILTNYKNTVKEARLLDFEIKRSTPIGYVGTDMCKSCHKKEFQSWLTKQDHSHAFATLQKQNYHHDPECVKCHVVGYEFAEGFRNWEESDYLINVGCENCHGPGARHAFDPKPGYGKTTGEMTCTVCHDKDHSPKFDYNKYREKIRHWPKNE
ncbi:cytochrome c family protein [Candidatus Uabimicrobium amorphum]|uniref:Cytochrome c554 n=1 Tax=Uabimicrobium amorphum TaxID=2596890 RepID=A0A5S9F3E9_UABAM|nr:cytochrome c family protein [Candidatus Uabimicrobium amorphum]BBM83082.1 cytochrome c554 [Candidatus Uabimicrobium amorphum]